MAEPMVQTTPPQCRRILPGYSGLMEAADLVTLDGLPLVWDLRLLGWPTPPSS
jgi:hypothetical protein